MKIAIGTIREPKIEGIKQGVRDCPYFADVENIEYIAERVASNVSDMPLTIEETMQGAKNRAQNLIKKGIKAGLYVGLEGGTMVIGDKTYLGGVVYIENNGGEGHYGLSSFIEVPEEIRRRLYESLEELGLIMGELSGKVDIRSQEGSIGAWSGDMFTRKGEFAAAFKAAIAPFHNKYYNL